MFHQKVLNSILSIIHNKIFLRTNGRSKLSYGIIEICILSYGILLVCCIKFDICAINTCMYNIWINFDKLLGLIKTFQIILIFFSYYIFFEFFPLFYITMLSFINHYIFLSWDRFSIRPAAPNVKIRMWLPRAGCRLLV